MWFKQHTLKLCHSLCIVADAGNGRLFYSTTLATGSRWTVMQLTMPRASWASSVSLRRFLMWGLCSWTWPSSSRQFYPSDVFFCSPTFCMIVLCFRGSLMFRIAIPLIINCCLVIVIITLVIFIQPNDNGKWEKFRGINLTDEKLFHGLDNSLVFAYKKA